MKITHIYSYKIQLKFALQTGYTILSMRLTQLAWTILKDS